MRATVVIEIDIIVDMNASITSIENEMPTMGVTESRRKFGELLRHFEAGGEPIRITRRQGTSAVLISYAEYQDLMEYQRTLEQQSVGQDDGTSEGSNR